MVSSDAAMFEPGALKPFDAVVMLNTTGSVFLPADYKKLSKSKQKAAQARDAALKKSFLTFVGGGKGVVGIHAATDCLYERADDGEMMGAYFGGQPGGAG